MARPIAASGVSQGKMPVAWGKIAPLLSGRYDQLKNCCQHVVFVLFY
jgi:hypothetical protein